MTKAKEAKDGEEKGIASISYNLEAEANREPKQLISEPTEE